jgi:hypothetical protein
MFDVARALVEGALANDRFIEQPEGYEDGSVGRMLFELLAACWPGVPMTSLAARRRTEPARIEAELQAHLRLFQ